MTAAPSGRALEPAHVPTETLELHPAAGLVPQMRDDEWKAFRNDIEANGIHTPLQVDGRGRVVDGAHRLRAARELGLRTVPVVRAPLPDEDDDDAVALFVLRSALHRRHLTDDQRAVLAAKAAQHLARMSRQRRARSAAAARWGGGEGSAERSDRADRAAGDQDAHAAAPAGGMGTTPDPGLGPAATVPPAEAGVQAGTGAGDAAQAQGQTRGVGVSSAQDRPLPGERVRVFVAKEFGVSERKVRQAQQLLATDRALADLVAKGMASLNQALRDRREGPCSLPGAVVRELPRPVGRTMFVMNEDGTVRRVWVPVSPAPAPAATPGGRAGERERPGVSSIEVPLDPAAAATVLVHAFTPEALATVLVHAFTPETLVAVLVQAFTPEALRELTRRLGEWLSAHGHATEAS
jgi:hypothetical protein